MDYVQCHLPLESGVFKVSYHDMLIYIMSIKNILVYILI